MCKSVHGAVGGTQVVDVGGGTGFCTQGIVQHVPPSNVTLMDQSPDQLNKARGKADLQGVTIVEVHTRAGRDLCLLSWVWPGKLPRLGYGREGGRRHAREGTAAVLLHI